MSINLLENTITKFVFFCSISPKMTDCTFKGTAYAAVTPSTLLCLLRVKLCLSENISEFNNNRQEMFKVKELFSFFFLT